VRIAAAPFQPFDLPAAPSHSPAILIEAAMTGLATGALVWLAARWDPLRMRLAKVS
jgi:hypothetical protein